MSFIFRAYHAMARQRPMSTRTGIPTAATYVFVNMLRKLRDDFAPEYLAAVFDVAAPTFRDQQAAAITSVRRFDSKTQTWQEQAYAGYKATRAEMPGDLAQQLPYIRRALEAYRIPVLEMPGYEADDVIGTLARQAAAQSYPVYVVSSDKDMLQLVDEHICVLNPPKDNLICDRAKVEEILGVPPERVIDVMALRGDSIDNIPGAPGIGDKGSVELIRRFGSLEATLDRAAEVERKTYRESLQNNRENILLSKQLVTIDTAVPVELDIAAMRASEPDPAGCRALFTELEFTTLLKDFAPAVELGTTDYAEAKSPEDVRSVVAAASEQQPLAFAVTRASNGGEPSTPVEEEEESESQELSLSLPLTLPSLAAMPIDNSPQVAISSSAGHARTLKLDESGAASELRAALANEAVPKAVHDLKSALRTLEPRGVALAGVQHDGMLYSYLLDPTYSSHGLAEVAFRRHSLKLTDDLAQAADLTGRLVLLLRKEVEEQELLPVYEQIDLPLAPVLARME